MFRRRSSITLLLLSGSEYEEVFVIDGAAQEFDTNTEFSLKAKMFVAFAFMSVLDLVEYIATLEEYLPEDLQPIEGQLHRSSI